ncbi:MAG: TetR/AcrR family transcriptional regulator [Lachnospiraceae bacterium]|nr:TetR/AcrR family transcriptional regulator [Lachnospiraceae bacterium]
MPGKQIADIDYFREMKLTKSQRRIVDTFLKMRRKKALEDIKVVELCEIADVNKSTFYSYYHDIYDLSDRLQMEVFKRIISELDHPDSIINEPGRFTVDVLNYCKPDVGIMRTLFSGSQSYKLPMKMEEAIKERFYQYKPEHKGDMKHAVMLSYKIYGAFFAFQNNMNFNQDDVIRYIGELSSSFALHIEK